LIPQNEDHLKSNLGIKSLQVLEFRVESFFWLQNNLSKNKLFSTLERNSPFFFESQNFFI
jgi:hypothetical protein